MVVSDVLNGSSNIACHNVFLAGKSIHITFEHVRKSLQRQVLHEPSLWTALLKVKNSIAKSSLRGNVV